MGRGDASLILAIASRTSSFPHRGQSPWQPASATSQCVPSMPHAIFFPHRPLSTNMPVHICWCNCVTSCEALLSLTPAEEVAEEDYSILGKTSWSQSWLFFLGLPLEKLHKLLHCPMPVKMSVRAITFSLLPLAFYLLSLIAVANVTSKDNDTLLNKIAINMIMIIE